MTRCIDCGGEIVEGQDHRCHTTSRQFVRIAMSGHPMHGCVGEVFGSDANGMLHVQTLGSSFSGWFMPADLQQISRGTRVTIEVEIRDFYNESMMIAGGWMPLSRIKAICQ
jgi:hypothetical protein